MQHHEQKGLTIVLKLGTSSIVDERTREPILSILTLIVEAAVTLKKAGHNVIIVSSGAVGVGLRRMDMAKRPTHVPAVQALAAIGQCRLMSLWDSLFEHLRQPIAQVLLTRNDISDRLQRTQYTNARNTLKELLNMGVIPIVNENDTLAVSEIKFGDNDTLSAITAAMVNANLLFLLTDVDGLFTSNPRTNPDAQVLEEVTDISALQADVSSAGSALGTGGMSTKITAAKLATAAGVMTIITRSSTPRKITDIVHWLEITANGSNIPADLGKPPLHTRFVPSSTPMLSRSFWILHGLKPHGTVYIDHGAYNAIHDKAAGLLPAGIVGVDGHFGQQESVRIVVVHRSDKTSLDGNFSLVSEPPKEVGRALVNYGATEISLIKGMRSTQIYGVLGYADSEYVALRENISFFDAPSPSLRGSSPDLEE
ncbi:hypothetical protein KEM55_002272 [Ascosphaera atra]|nr:hypothetical protein KEM55_002272 [Ascosphaera atra]